jgi:hypothetical protein
MVFCSVYRGALLSLVYLTSLTTYFYSDFNNLLGTIDVFVSTLLIFLVFLVVLECVYSNLLTELVVEVAHFVLGSVKDIALGVF